MRILLLFLIVLFTHDSYSQNDSCLSFNGINQRITTTNTSLNTIGTGDFTFEAWINGNLNPNSSHPTIFSNRNTITEGTIFFFHNYWGGSNAKMLCVQLFGANHLIVNNGSINGEILDGTCHHVAITKVENLLTYYVDGIPFGTKNVFVSNPTITSTANIWIGQDPIVNSTFDGSISMIKIWNVGLSGVELNKSLNCDSTLQYTPIAFWKLNEGTGQLVKESIANTNSSLGLTQSIEASDPNWNSECCIQDTTGCIPDYTPVPTILEFPNIVTVNGDNINDLFTPITVEGVHEMNTKILNRWGNVVYETSDIQINWSPVNVSEGIYYYITNYRSGNQWDTVHGFIQVVK